MPAERTLRPMIVVAGVWLAGVAPTRGQSPDCPAWEQRHPMHAPRPQYGHAMAYDSARGVTVLVGAGTWEWDGADWTMVSERGWSYPQMTYDQTRHVCVLFKGDSTWEWDGVEWTLRETGVPPWRSNSAMAYDSARGVTVLFGGYWQLNDTWEWDGSQWELRATTGPAPRWEHAMAYDSRRHVTVLYGGWPSGSSQTWEWDGRVWVLRTAFVGPELRAAHSMAYDSARGVTLLFSGLGSDRRAGLQTWEWDGVAWTLFSETGPPARLYSAMAYDSTRSVTVLFGGSQVGASSDTWELPSCPRDSDGDGVDDPDDECDISDLRSTIVIDACDTGVVNQLFDDGCTMADRIGECAADGDNHGNFVSCVAQLTYGWVDDGVISTRDKGPIQRCTAQADLPQAHVNGRNLSKGESTSPTEPLWRR